MGIDFKMSLFKPSGWESHKWQYSIDGLCSQLSVNLTWTRDIKWYKDLPVGLPHFSPNREGEQYGQDRRLVSI